ncbi:PadR family transcriptional regulator, partial [Cellulomonas sp. A375-1]
LTSEWNTDESRPRKFYRTSAAGRQLARTLTDELRAIAAAVDALPDKE